MTPVPAAFSRPSHVCVGFPAPPLLVRSPLPVACWPPVGTVPHCTPAFGSAPRDLSAGSQAVQFSAHVLGVWRRSRSDYSYESRQSGLRPALDRPQSHVAHFVYVSERRPQTWSPASWRWPPTFSQSAAVQARWLHLRQPSVHSVHNVVLVNNNYNENLR